jgi:hypothetical protein
VKIKGSEWESRRTSLLEKKNVGSSLGVILFEYLVFGLLRLVSCDTLLCRKFIVVGGDKE